MDVVAFPVLCSPLGCSPATSWLYLVRKRALLSEVVKYAELAESGLLEESADGVTGVDGIESILKPR
jgi:hypothetical protein